MVLSTSGRAALQDGSPFWAVPLSHAHGQTVYLHAARPLVLVWRVDLHAVQAEAERSGLQGIMRAEDLEFGLVVDGELVASKSLPTSGRRDELAFELYPGTLPAVGEVTDMSFQVMISGQEGPIGRATDSMELLLRKGEAPNGSGAGSAKSPFRLHSTLIGRLGNQLFQWSSLSGIASLHDMQVCLEGGDLAKFFEGVKDSEAECVLPTPAMRVSEGSKYAVHNSFQLTQSTVLHGYLQSWKYFDQNLRSALKFKQTVEEQAATFLSGFGSMTFVGIHVRHLHQREVDYLRFPPAEYFQNVMTYFRSKYTDVMFVVTSDDTAWCSEQDVFAVPDVQVVTQQHGAAVDMAILAACDHIAITCGTFGWWAAYLGADQKGGEVVYYDSGFDMDHPTNRGNVVLVDYYPPGWQQMGGPRINSDFKTPKMLHEELASVPEARRTKLVIVCHPDDESIFAAEFLGAESHVIVVTDANSAGEGVQRRRALGNAMELTDTTWEMWDFPETRYEGPTAPGGWDRITQSKLKYRLIDVLRAHNWHAVITHNPFGEYGHIDHRVLHQVAVLSFQQVYRCGKAWSCSMQSPTLRVFAPELDYDNVIDRLVNPPARCLEHAMRSELLASYQRDGCLHESDLFRSLCYNFEILYRSAWEVVINEPKLDDSNIVHLPPNSAAFPRHRHTVVTAYFKVASKHTHSEYVEWMRNMLSLQDAMVIFSSPEMHDSIIEMRSHAIEKTLIVPMTLMDSQICGSYDDAFWERQLQRDPELATKHQGISHHLFCLWLSKSWFVTEAARANPFSSEIFLWSDIGSFRNDDYNGKLWVQNFGIIPRTSILMMAARQPREIGDWVIKEKHEVFIAGAQLAGRRDTWKHFNRAFEATLKGYVKHGHFIGEDQAVMETTCMHHPGLCVFVTEKMVQGDEWFGLQDALHRHSIESADLVQFPQRVGHGSYEYNSVVNTTTEFEVLQRQRKDAKNKGVAADDQAVNETAHLHHTIWQVWLGDDPPEVVNFAHQSCKDVHSNSRLRVLLLTRAELSNFLPTLHPSFDLLDRVEQSDYLRIELLHHHGGFYLDADVICLRSLEHLLDDLQYWNASGARNRVDYPPLQKRGVSTVFSQCTLGPVRAGCLQTASWHRKLMQIMDRLTPALQECHSEYVGKIPYPLPRKVGTSICGVKWGELIDHINPELWRLESNGSVGFGMSLCDELGRGLGFDDESPCHVVHIGLAGQYSVSHNWTKQTFCQIKVFSNTELCRRNRPSAFLEPFEVEMRKVSFVSKPRCASTFISDRFGFSREHYHLVALKLPVSEFYLACIRTPYDLIISWFTHHRFTSKISKAVKAFYPPDINEWVVGMMCRTHWSRSQILASGTSNPLFQWQWVAGVEDRTILVRYENLLSDLDKFGWNVTTNTHRRNSSPSNERQRLNQTSIAVIQSLFAKDFQRFGYSLIPPSSVSLSPLAQVPSLFFISKPRCASNYIDDLLFGSRRIDTHRSGQFLSQQHPNSHFLMCVRDPLDLVVSWYTYHRNSRLEGKEVRHFYPNDLDAWVLEMDCATHWGALFHRHTPVEWHDLNPLHQVAWLPSKSTGAEVHVIHFEHLDAELKEMARAFQIGISREKPFLNQSPGNKPSLGDASKRRLRALFHDDFHRFGYGTELLCTHRKRSETTVVTAIWDINREEEGDGRSFGEYMRWIENTLQLNASIMLFADRTTIEAVRARRDATGFPTCYVAMRFQDHPYFKRFYDDNRRVVESSEYRSQVQHPGRVEVVNPRYNILQWGKIELMRMAVRDYNPFQSQNVIWVDAGLSRFLPDEISDLPFPDTVVARKLAKTGGLTIEMSSKYALEPTLKRICGLTDKGLLGSENILIGGVLIGSAASISAFEAALDSFLRAALRANRTANDQILYAAMYCNDPELFKIVQVDSHEKSHVKLHHTLFSDVEHPIMVTKGHGCLNEFNPAHKSAVWTMLTDDTNYVTGAVVLGQSVRLNLDIPIDLVVMELQSKPLEREDWTRLRAVGWKRCVVPRIAPLDEENTFARFRDQFTKIQLWRMTSYETILYMDADTIVIRSIDSLLHMDMNGKAVGAARDIRAGVWMDTFNFGVFLMHPNIEEYHRLVNLQAVGSVAFETTMCEQGWFNEVYRGRWHDIGFIHNANLASYVQDPYTWDAYWESLTVIHFTMNKPWTACEEEYLAICRIWQDAHIEGSRGLDGEIIGFGADKRNLSHSYHHIRLQETALHDLRNLEWYDTHNGYTIDCSRETGSPHNSAIQVKRREPFVSSERVTCNEWWGCYEVTGKEFWDSAQMHERDCFRKTSLSDYLKDQERAIQSFRDGFNNFSALPQIKNVRCAEVAPGPFTRWKVVRHFREDVSCRTMLAIDPLMEVWRQSEGSPFFNSSEMDGAKLKFVSAPLEDVQVQDGSVDLLIIFNALPHVQNAFRFLDQAFRMLAPGGHLILFEIIYFDNIHEEVHPIKVRWPVWEGFLGGFQVLHSNIRDEACRSSPDKGYAGGIYGESGNIFVIARKAEDRFPYYATCPESKCPLQVDSHEKSHVKLHHTLFSDVEHPIMVTKGHGCLNEFNPAHKSAVWTMLTDDTNYVTGAVVLGQSVRLNLDIPIDLVVMELQSKPLEREDWTRLRAVGWKRCVVPRIAPLDEENTFARFRDQFTKIQLWRMTSYETILYMDADTIVIRSIDSLLHMDMNGKAVGAARDIRAGVWMDTFNFGVFLMHPNIEEYHRLVNLQAVGSVAFETTMCEQGWFNEVYRGRWHDIGFIHNANLASYVQDPYTWDAYWESLTVIHFTMNKPWTACEEEYLAICRIWQDAHIQGSCENEDYYIHDDVQRQVCISNLLWRHYQELISKMKLRSIRGSVVENNGQLLAFSQHARNIPSRRRIPTICETGFSMGLSAAMFLSANSAARVVSLDLVNHSVAVSHLKSHIPNRFIFILGDSAQEIPRLQESLAELGIEDFDGCDLIMIDGDYSQEGPLRELRLLRDFSKIHTRLLIDDCHTDENLQCNHARTSSVLAAISDGMINSVSSFAVPRMDSLNFSTSAILGPPTNPLACWCEARYDGVVTDEPQVLPREHSERHKEHEIMASGMRELTSPEITNSSSDVYVFSHVPKTAGSSFQQDFLAALSGTSKVCQHRKWWEHDFRRVLKGESSCKVVSGVVNLPSILSISPNAKVAILLRSPVTHTISCFEHLRRIANVDVKIAIEEHLQLIPKYTSWLAGQAFVDSDEIPVGNYRVKFDGGQSGKLGHAPPERVWVQWESTVEGSVTQSIQRLKRLWFVGITEWYHESFCLLLYQIGKYDWDFCDCSSTVRKTSLLRRGKETSGGSETPALSELNVLPSTRYNFTQAMLKGMHSERKRDELIYGFAQNLFIFRIEKAQADLNSIFLCDQ